MIVTLFASSLYGNLIRLLTFSFNYVILIFFKIDNIRSGGNSEFVSDARLQVY